MEYFESSTNEHSIDSQNEGGVEQEPSGTGMAIDLSLYFLLRSATEIVDHVEAIDRLLSQVADERERLQLDLSRVRREREALVNHIQELKTATEIETTALREQAQEDAAAIVADAEKIRTRAVEDARALESRVHAAEKRARAILNDLLGSASLSGYPEETENAPLYRSTDAQTGPVNSHFENLSTAASYQYEPAAQSETAEAEANADSWSRAQEEPQPEEAPQAQPTQSWESEPTASQTKTEMAEPVAPIETEDEAEAEPVTENAEVIKIENVVETEPFTEEQAEHAEHDNQFIPQSSIDSTSSEEDAEEKSAEAQDTTEQASSVWEPVIEEPGAASVVNLFQSVEPISAETESEAQQPTEITESKTYRITVHPIRSFGSLQELEKRIGAVGSIDSLEIVDWQSPVAAIEAKSRISKAQLIEAITVQIPNGQVVKDENDELELELSHTVGA